MWMIIIRIDDGYYWVNSHIENYWHYWLLRIILLSIMENEDTDFTNNRWDWQDASCLAIFSCHVFMHFAKTLPSKVWIPTWTYEYPWISRGILEHFWPANVWILHNATIWWEYPSGSPSPPMATITGMSLVRWMEKIGL